MTLSYRFIKKAGFTLIELMIAVSIIGVLASIAIPKFSDLIRKSKEGALKGQLGGLRSALSIYYGDMEGQYPKGLSGLTINGKYLSVVPYPVIPDYHPIAPPANPPDNDISVFCFPAYWATGSADGGADNPWTQWVYCTDSTQSSWGQVYIQCTHTDTRGTVWSSY